MVRVNLVKPKIYGDVGFTRADLLKIGARAIDQIIRRCDKAQDINDRAAKPLSATYRQKKVAQGQPGVRNLSRSGSMLGALTVVEATSDRVVIGFTRRAEQIKAEKNEQRNHWFGLSPNNEANVMQFAERILKNKVTS